MKKNSIRLLNEYSIVELIKNDNYIAHIPV